MKSAGPLSRIYIHRHLLWMWIRQQLKDRYYETRLGPLWLVVQPLLMALVFTIAFTVVARIDSRGVSYPLFFLVGFVLWNYFSYCVNRSSVVIETNRALVTHHAFPRELLVLAIAVSALPELLVGAAVVLILGLLFAVPLTASALLVIPVTAGLVVFTLGVSFWVSTASALFRDLKPFLPSALRALFYLSPIIYPATSVPLRWSGVYLSNPLAGFIVSCRDLLFEGRLLHPGTLLLGVGAAIAALVTGYVAFRAAEPRFADLL